MEDVIPFRLRGRGCEPAVSVAAASAFVTDSVSMSIVCESDSSLALFHPVIQDWFRSRFARPTEPQELGWPEITANS